MTNPNQGHTVTEDDDGNPIIVTPDGQQLSPTGFVDWLNSYPNNSLGLQLSEGLAECVNATQLLDKVSTLTLKVSIGPGSSDFGELIVSPVVTVKPAEPRPEARAFYPTPNGGLSRRDPNQPTIPGME